MNVVRVPQLAWHGTKALELPLPPHWDVEVCNMAGYNRPALHPEAIKTAIETPIGMPPIRQLAQGRQEVVVIFDDMTRITRVAKIVPFVLDELSAAGIPDNSIRFIVALGAHGALNRLDLVRKLGETTLARFPVYNHNPFGSCVRVGTTSAFGTEVCINAEVMACDLKIAIGSVVPHAASGFGGGGKIILPGVASFESIKHNHAMAARARKQCPEKTLIGMGVFDDNPMRRDIDEAAALAGLDVLINSVVNMWGQAVSIFAGAPVPAYAAAVEEARTHYLTPRVRGKHIAVANTFAKANEAFIGLNIACQALHAGGGDVVMIANAPDGQVTHYLAGPFGKAAQGLLKAPPGELPPNLRHLIVYTEFPDRQIRDWLPASDKVVLLHAWNDVLQLLQENNGADTRVVVYPNAEIQYCA